ncbi:COP23 domain-containing protein [Nostoc commune]|uniref:COP23 domain-containing protein n=1 Tax=Nostoc commune TaxID=1178 RepID=UPI0018C4FA0F|nr:COP23 domain-containing protein [Nostoc commune]
MNSKLIVSLFTGCVLAATCITSMISQASQAKADDGVRFICASGYDQQTDKRFPTSYAWTTRGKIAIIRWKYPWFNSQTITPEQRCEQVTSRFQTAYNNQSLSYITNGTANGQAVICTAKQVDASCNTVLLTLRPQDDSLQILDELKEILRGRSTRPIEHSSKKPQVYYKIDIKKFLQTAPVEKE